jgi:DNA repair exonuclease SbcCD ATPase subunit
MKATVKQIADFYKVYPQYKGHIDVETRFGFNPIDEADVTAYNEQVYEIETDAGKNLKCSGNHRVFTGVEFVKVQHLNVNEIVHTKDGCETIKYVRGTNLFKNLYDLQVRNVKEYYSNGITSHNSTIADALYFAIFGTTLRELKKEFISNNITQNTCEVQLEFDVNQNGNTNTYNIIRTLSPSRLFLYKDGNDITLDTIANTNSYIETVLSSSPEVFRNCVLMTLNDTLPFMSKSKVEKRKFIEQIFNLQVFSAMMSSLREDQNSTKRELDIENARLSEIKNSVSAFEKQKELKSKEKETKILAINKKIKDNEAEIQKIETDIQNEVIINQTEKNTELEKYTKALVKVEELCNQTLGNVATVKNEIKTKKEQLQKVGTTEQICPTCLRPISEHDIEEIEKEKKNMHNDVLKLVETLSAYVKEANGLEDKKSKIKKHIDSLNKDIKLAAVQETTRQSNKKRITDLQNLNKQLQEGSITISNDVTTFDELIKEANTKIETSNNTIQSLKKKADMLEVVKFVISEEGVKSFLVKKILQNFNAKLAFYLKKLDSNSICIFNEYFEEEILNEKGKICLYNNFSGAERKAIDLACLFSFIDMRKTHGDVYYNVTVYDELFDTSLDQRGVELVVDILKERVETFKESILIISHRKESVKAVNGDIIFLEKHNGITKRVNFVD